MTTLAAFEAGSEIAALVVAAAGTTASVIERQRAAAIQENLFQQQQVQLRLQQTDAAAKRTDQLRRIFGEQAVEEIARGVSLASPSFQAIQQQSFNAFNDDNRAESLNTSFKINALNSQIDATREAAFGGSAGSIGSFALSSFNQLNLNNPNNINNQQVFNANDFEGARALPRSGPGSLPSPF